MKCTETNSTRKTRKKCIKKRKVVDRYAIRGIIKVYKEIHVLKQTNKKTPPPKSLKAKHSKTSIKIPFEGKVLMTSPIS